MTTEEGAHSRSDRLADLIRRFDDADDVEYAFITELIATVTRSDPDLAEAIRVCAIPHVVDQEIFAVLRGGQSEPERDKALLLRVQSYHFAIPRERGGFAYHDNTRDALLKDWRSTLELAERFREINGRLARYFENGYEKIQQAERDLDSLSALMREACPARLRRLRSIIESAGTARLLEALYHQFLISADTGIYFLQTMYFALEIADRLATCSSLCASARDLLERLPAQDRQPEHLAWIDYLDTRLLMRLPPYSYALAEARLRELSEQAGLSPDLRMLILDGLAEAYATELKTPDAIRARHALIKESAELGWSEEPTAHYALGALYMRSRDYDSAKEYFQQAIEIAESPAATRLDTGVFARLELATIHADLAEWEQAIEACFDALRLTRTAFGATRALAALVPARFASILVSYDLVAAQTAAREAIAIATPLGGLSTRLTIEFADALRKAGRLARAQEWITEAAKGLGDTPGNWEMRNMLHWSQAMVLTDRGRDAEAAKYLGLIEEEMRDRPEGRWPVAAALTNLGQRRVALGLLAQAEQDISAAERDWTSFGLPAQSATAAIITADALRRRGLFADAAAKLTRCDADLPAGIDFDRAALNVAWGQLHESQGRWQQARDSYAQAQQVYQAQRLPLPLAQVQLHLARIAAAQSDWPAAQQHADQASAVAAGLASGEPAPTAEADSQAMADNVKGMRSFCQATDRTAALEQAREFFRSATQRAPGNFWPQVNLAFTLAEQQDWPNARAALEAAIDHGPAIIRSAPLYRIYRDYSIHHAQQIRHDEGPAAAAEALDGASRYLSGKLPATEIAQIQIASAALTALSGPASPSGTVTKDLDDATGELAETTADAGQPGESLGALLLTFIPDVPGYWVVDDMLDRLARSTRPGSASQQALATARRAIEAYFSLRFQLGAETLASSAQIRPVVMEFGATLLPYIDPEQDGGHFLHTLIPQMRARLKDRIGITVPSVNFTDNFALPANGYRIIIGDKARDGGTIPATGSFVPSAHLPEGLAGRPAGTDPATGEAGAWLDAHDIEQHGIDPAAPIGAPAFLSHLLEATLRTWARRIFGIGEARQLIAAWGTDEGSDPLAGLADSDAATYRLAVLLRLLVAGSMPLADWRAILATVQEAGGLSRPLRELVGAVRIAHREKLPGNQPGRTRIAVPDRFSAPPESLPARYELMSWLFEQEVNGKLTLITGSGELRQWLSDWLPPELGVEALSADEAVQA
jgi:tetratricopeptide (TPR) repeat protein